MTFAPHLAISRITEHVVLLRGECVVPCQTLTYERLGWGLASLSEWLSIHY
jgi:hypothetical protein